MLSGLQHRTVSRQSGGEWNAPAGGWRGAEGGFLHTLHSCSLFPFSKENPGISSQLHVLVVLVRGNFIVLPTVISTEVAQNDFLIYTFGTRGCLGAYTACEGLLSVTSATGFCHCLAHFCLPCSGLPGRAGWRYPSHSHCCLVGYNLVTCQEISKSLSFVAFKIFKDSILFLFLKDLKFGVG